MSFLRRSRSLPVAIPVKARFQVDFELERRQRDAREAIVKAQLNVDREKRIKALWLVK